MHYQSIEEIFEDFQKVKALIIGDVMVDAYIWGKVDRISPEAPVPVVRVKKRDYRLGGAANVALNVQALGATPILCALAGKDEGGQKLLQRMDERDIIHSGIVQSEERPTTVKTRVISANHHIVRVDEESDQAASANEEDLLLQKISSLLPDCQVVIFEDYDKGTLTPKIITETIALAKKHNIPTVVDPKKRNFLAYKETTLFKPNLKELKEGLKIEFNAKEISAIDKAVDKLIKATQSKSAMVTLSELGVYIKDGSEQYHIPAHLREIADVSGAGDTVISIAGLCIALGLSARITAALSNLGGGLVCEHVGVVPIDREQLVLEAKKNIIP